MKLLAAWRAVRSKERYLWQKPQMKIIMQARIVSRGPRQDRTTLHVEIRAYRICWDHRLAKIDSFLASTLRTKCAAVRADKRARIKLVDHEAAHAADIGDTKSVFSCIRKLEPQKMRLVRTPTEIAERRRQHASSELGGLPIEFAALHALSTMHQWEAFVEPLLPPTLDEVIDVIMAYKRGKALGTDAIAMELIQLGGLPAAALLHGLICACWQQCQTPLCWKGGRLVYLDKPGGVKFVCCDKGGILINDQISTIHGRLLRPQLLALAGNWPVQKGLYFGCALLLDSLCCGQATRRFSRGTLLGCQGSVLWGHSTAGCRIGSTGRYLACRPARFVSAY